MRIMLASDVPENKAMTVQILPCSVNIQELLPKRRALVLRQLRGHVGHNGNWAFNVEFGFRKND
jgi:hypothetical protein